MSRVCVLTGKRPRAGNRVSRSKRWTKRRFEPNVHWKRMYDPVSGRMIRLRLSTRAMRTVDKKGLTACFNARGLTVPDPV